MRRNFNSLLVVLLLSCSISLAFGQEVEYKDVILDEKPAKLNLKTGKITLVNPEPTKAIDILKESEVTKDQERRKQASVESNQNRLDTIDSTHIVENGETLYSISRQYGLSVSELKRLNGLKNNTILIGQELLLDTGNYSQNNLNYWVVENGDTLYKIAKRNNTSVEVLKSLNGLKNNTIVIGQKLKLK